MSTCLIHPRAEPLPEGAQSLREFATSLISDAMGRVGGVPGLVPIPASAGPLFGPALTVRTRPGDNLVIHKALDLAEPGDVLVVDGGGAPDRALVGGLMCRYARSRGLAGVVIDGAVRDVSELGRLGLPVYARCVSHQGPDKNGPGEIGGPIVLSGTTVSSGDAIVADEDGVVVVPARRVAEIALAAAAVAANEEQANDDIDNGRWDRAWIDRVLTVIPAP